MPQGVYKRTKKMYASRTGSKHFAWKGDAVGYHAVHSWIKRNYGIANHCEQCGEDKLPEGKKYWFEWANISGEYKRDIVDWKQLCIRCHRKKDNWNGKLYKSFIESRCWENRQRNIMGQFIS